PVASGQTPTQKPEKPATQEKPAGQKMAASNNVQQELMQLEQKLADALIKGDMAAFGSHLGQCYAHGIRQWSAGILPAMSAQREQTFRQLSAQTIRLQCGNAAL
ncbi:MAG: hypothetical protein LC775_20440, partial [Acidobacteria bacterium]|nr:hypothetical protein [Acidobacteriota bacterium]